MALTNHERVGKALSLLQAGLYPFLARELEEAYGEKWRSKINTQLGDTRLSGGDGLLDVAAQLVVLDREWKDLFSSRLGRAHRAIVNELIPVRNDWAHQKTFSNDDTDRALDSVARLLRAVGAGKEADEADEIKHELRRATFDRKVYNERRKEAYQAIEGAAPTGLKPWRDVVTPHPDVASGNYQEAEFAADLWQVFKGNAAREYRDPVEFFRRTFLTQGLRELLLSSIRRWRKDAGGNPVVELQTTFGGGKTHSMLALFHLTAGIPAKDLPGMDGVLAEVGGDLPGKINRAVLVGNQLTPGQSEKKPDGVEIHTLWGELAWQLGGKAGYEKVRQADETATNPGDALGTVIRAAAPCLILIDEWVAYARQLMDDRKLIGGDFETQFTFAQTLSEQVKAIPGALLVVSIPASDHLDGVSPNAGVSDEEVGGSRGREAVARLRNVFQRVASQWRPANAEESYEIVRRRLFEPVDGKDAFTQRDLVVRAFTDHYTRHPGDFPAECRDADYLRKMQQAYPVHPEVFERLYQDWSGLVRFQRTRGVLRLMASVIHNLWESGDTGILILPAHMPIGAQKIEGELTRYLPHGWTTVIEKDVDGPDSTPRKIDAANNNLGRISATRRVARTLFLGSAPMSDASNRGMEDRRIKLGCTLPGEAPAVFGDALRYLAQSATYLYQDNARYWYATQPTVAKLAADRADELKRQRDRVLEEIMNRIREEMREPKRRGEFPRVHAFPGSSVDVPDEESVGLVVLSPESAWAKEQDSAAIVAAQKILDNRGSSPRLNRNTLIYLAADRQRLEELEDAARRFLAWDSILKEAEGERPSLNLDNFQRSQAAAQRKAFDQTVSSRILETYQVVLVPTQNSAGDPMTWGMHRATGQDPLAVRAWKKLKSAELVAPQLGAKVLSEYLKNVPLWRGNHVAIRQLAEDFSRYLYLQRLRGPEALCEAIQDGLTWTTWATETFAYAESFDEKQGRYAGLKAGQQVFVSSGSMLGVLVKPDVASAQLRADAAAAAASASSVNPAPGGSTVAPRQPVTLPAAGSSSVAGPSAPSQPRPPNHFYGIVKIDPSRMNRDVGQVSQEVVQHLVALLSANVEITLEIQATAPEGFPPNVVRTVSENSRTLKFIQQEFTQT
jgi:predicted AAA+ superfamily ATPase